LLTRQIQEAFGTTLPEGAAGRLVELVDLTYQRLAVLQKTSSDFGRVIPCEINFASGRLESGRHWKSLLGYRPEQLDDSLAGWRALAHPEDDAALFDDIAASARDRTRAFGRDCRFRDVRGEWHWLRIGGQVTDRDAAGAPLRAVAAIADVDAFRRTEASLQTAKEVAELSSRTRSAFLANMSHEIRTPMNAVLGMTELVLGTELDPEQRHYLAIVKSSAEALLTIINDILDFSKIEAGKLEFERVDFSLRAVVLEAVRTMALRAQEKGLEVLVAVAPQVPARLWGDPTRVRQVITNLVSNAIKFTEQGEVAVEVTVDRLDGDHVELRCCVRDTGIGIAADKQQAVFEAFAQADPTITRRFGGTGLGLAICTRLVELMGGRIWVDSEPGRGSRFYFTGCFGVEAAVSAEDRNRPRFPGRRALVALANPAAARLAAAALQEVGFQVTAAGDTSQALAALAAGLGTTARHELLLADAPLLLADDAALVTAWEEAGSQLPVVALHTLAEQQAGSATLRALGVDYHVVKPFAPEDLQDAAALALGGAATPEFEFEHFTVDENLAAAAAPGIGLEILLVEDNPINQELAVRLLEKSGHRVTVANHGEEALGLFDKNHYDVILMDVQMPVMGGIEATEAIRAREMRRSWIFSADHARGSYIIAMTANAMAGDRERCLQAGMNDYLSKPIRQAELTEALARAARELGRDIGAARPAAAAPAAAPVDGIDIDATERDLGDRELVLDLARTLLEQWEMHVAQLDAAFAARDAKALVLHAHTVKGFLAMFHAESARVRAMELELAAKREDWTASGSSLEVLKGELNRIKPLLASAVLPG
jgi:protein-histidine pros-kinase